MYEVPLTAEGETHCLCQACDFSGFFTNLPLPPPATSRDHSWKTCQMIVRPASRFVDIWVKSFCFNQACDFSRFFLIWGFYLNFLLPQNVLEGREVACIVSKPLVSCLWGCGESVNPPELNIQEAQGALSSRLKGDPGPLPICQDLLLSQITPLLCIFPWIVDMS